MARVFDVEGNPKCKICNGVFQEGVKELLKCYICGKNGFCASCLENHKEQQHDENEQKDYKGEEFY